MLVKEIEIGFENCEVMTFNKNIIGALYIDDIQTSIRRVACNAIEKFQIAKTFAIELFDEGNEDYYPLDVQEDDWKTKKFARIMQYDDITTVDVIYEDDSRESFYVDYDAGKDEDSLGAPNMNQKTYLSELKNLYLVISATKNLDDYFDKAKINDADNISFIKEMYDVGDVEYEEEELTIDNLPEFYRYIQLSEKIGPESWNREYMVAVRVPAPRSDAPNGWKFVYEPDPERECLNMPDKWQYFSNHLQNFILGTHQKKDDDFTIEKLKEKYPEKPVEE